MAIGKKRILVVGVGDVRGSTTVDVRRSLEDMGHLVDEFNYRTIEREKASSNLLKVVAEKITSYLRRFPTPLRRLYYRFPSRVYMNKQLLAQVKEHAYDLVLLFKTDTVDWMTVKEISKGVPTWYFFMDPPEQSVRMQGQMYARYATYASATFSSVVEHFKKENKQTYWIIQGEREANFLKEAPQEKDIDVVFVGTRDDRRTEVMNALATAGVNVQWHGVGGTHPPVYAEDMAEVYKRSKIILNVNREGEGFSNRIVRGLFSGSFVLSEISPDLVHHFAHQKHLAVYETPQECVRLTQHYLQHDDERERIASVGCAYAQSHFSWTNRMGVILRQCFG